MPYIFMQEIIFERTFSVENLPLVDDRLTPFKKLLNDLLVEVSSNTNSDSHWCLCNRWPLVDR